MPFYGGGGGGGAPKIAIFQFSSSGPLVNGNSFNFLTGLSTVYDPDGIGPGGNGSLNIYSFNVEWNIVSSVADIVGFSLQFETFGLGPGSQGDLYNANVIQEITTLAPFAGAAGSLSGSIFAVGTTNLTLNGSVGTGAITSAVTLAPFDSFWRVESFS